MSRAETMLLLAVSGLAAACNRPSTPHAAVQRWLLCEECIEGELAAVVALQDAAVDELGSALSGPPTPARRNIQAQVEEAYRTLPAPPVSESVYVNHFVDNYVATYQSRAAVALSQIGTPRADALLLAAVRSDTTSREDVRRHLDAAAPVKASAVDSTPQEAPVSTLVQISPAVRVVSARDPLRREQGIRAVFRVESGGGAVEGDSVVLTDGNGLATVRWRLGPGVDSLNTLRAEVAGGPVWFRATGRAATRRLVFVTPPRTVRMGDTLAVPVSVAVVTISGQPDSTFAGTVELLVAGTPFALAKPLANGRATFSGLTFNFTGTGVRLIARVPGAREAVSDRFDVLP